MGDLSGARIVITGASSGVGAACARLAAESGADVALLARSRTGLERSARVARRHGVDAHVVPVDLGDREAAVAAIDRAAALLGGIDVLVSNAGVAPFGHVDELDPEDFDRTMDVTFGGAVAVVRAALPHLERSGGVIVATGSTMARLPLPGFASYAAAKHALRGFLGSLRVELRSAGSPVRVAMVHPGPIDTPLWSRVTSATGRLPRVPPDGYDAEVVARALLATAAHPRAEVSVGAQARALEVLFAVARPAADALLVFIDRWYRSNDAEQTATGSLWAPSGDGDEAGGAPRRTSLAMPVRLGIGPPDLRAPVRLARNLVVGAPVAGRVAAGLAGSRARERGRTAECPPIAEAGTPSSKRRPLSASRS